MEQFIAHRKRRGFSQSEVASHTGISTSAISACENGRREPGTATLEKLAGAIGLRVLLIDVGRASPVAEHASVLAAALRAGDADLAFATLRTISVELQYASPSEMVVLSYQQPAAIDPQWDAAIAGVVEWRLQQAAAPIPMWVTECRRDPADAWAPSMAVQFEDAQTSDVQSLADRGILIHSMDLEFD